MDKLKNIIETNRDIFESEELLIGHKERFLKKSRDFKKRKTQVKQFKIYLLAAAAITFMLVTPLKNIMIESKSNNYYLSLLETKSSAVYEMANGLDTYNRDMVINTLEGLIHEAVPFDSQLPEELNTKERRELAGLYYKPKIEGVERLKGYVGELLLNK
ncbi:MAG: hypothetical protein Q8R90_09025 [Bacteroidales bacterium]|jgi:hypothetical protein|nr:hypothetical protein [Bacteroidales bacterium]